MGAAYPRGFTVSITCHDYDYNHDYNYSVIIIAIMNRTDEEVIIIRIN